MYIYVSVKALTNLTRFAHCSCRKLTPTMAAAARLFRCVKHNKKESPTRHVKRGDPFKELGLVPGFFTAYNLNFQVKSGKVTGMELDSRKLDELLEVTHENNKILRSMRRAQRWSSLFRFIYWAVILGSILGVYYYFQPTIQKYMKTFQTSIGIIQNFEKAAGSIPTDVQSVKNLINKQFLLILKK